MGFDPGIDAKGITKSLDPSPDTKEHYDGL